MSFIHSGDLSSCDVRGFLRAATIRSLQSVIPLSHLTLGLPQIQIVCGEESVNFPSSHCSFFSIDRRGAKNPPGSREITNHWNHHHKKKKKAAGQSELISGAFESFVYLVLLWASLVAQEFP